MSSLVTAVEQLYASVVTEPERWNEQAFADWSESLAPEVGLDKETARHVRKAMRMALKLREFWSADANRTDVGWRSKVDIALGPKAWRPVLELATLELHSNPSEDTFAEAARLFRIVNNTEFMDGVPFDEWSQQLT